MEIRPAITKDQEELSFIINVLVPEQKANGTMAIHCRTAVDREAEKAVEQDGEKHCKNTVRKKRKALADRFGILLAVCASAICYLAVAAAEMTRRGYYSVGGELFLALAVGYITYRIVSTKKPLPNGRSL